VYPITYEEVRELVRRRVLATRTARSVVRKSGFRTSAASAESEPLPRMILAAPPAVPVSGGTTSASV
jgi:hypothetical protein